MILGLAGFINVQTILFLIIFLAFYMFIWQIQIQYLSLYINITLYSNKVIGHYYQFYQKSGMQQVQSSQKIPQTIFFSIQCGAIQLNKQIKKAYLMLGNDKAGKTVCAHYLAQNKLIGTQQSNYKLDQLSDALIGQDQKQLQTIIPNLFQIKHYNSCYLIDGPGFIDSFGSLKTISKNNFIYELISKPKEIKFILVIKQENLKFAANQMKKTFVSFFNLFKSNNIINEYLSSVCLIINEVSQQNDIQKIKKKYQNTPNQIGKQSYNQNYQTLKNHLLSNDLIFIIKKAIPNKQANLDIDMLKQIDKKCNKWWVSSQDKLKVSIYDYIDNRQYIAKEFKKVQQYYKKQFKNTLNMFKSKCQVFVEQRSSSFITTIKKQLTQMQIKQNKLVQQNKQFKKLYNLHKNTIQNYKKTLFKWKDLFIQPDCPQIDENLIPMDLQIMKAYFKIIQITQKIKTINGKQSFKIIQQSKNILTIFINLTKNNSQDQRKVIDFSYNLYIKLISCYQIYTVFLRAQKHLTANDILVPQIQQYIKICKLFATDLKAIFDFVNTACYKILINYIIQQFDQNKDYQLVAIYSYYKKFIMDVKQHIKAKSIQQLNRFHIDQNILKSTQRIFNRKIQILEIKILQYKTFNQQIRYIHKVLFELKNFITKTVVKITQYLANIKQDQEEKLKDYTDIIRVMQLMAYCLKQMNCIETAFKIYEIINDADSILQYYQHKQAQMITKYDIKNTTSKKQMIKFLSQYMKKLYKYHKIDLSLKKAQKAYSIAQLLGDQDSISQIGKYIKMLYECNTRIVQASIGQSQNQYLSFVSKGVSLVKLSTELNRQIQKLIVDYNPNL